MAKAPREKISKLPPIPSWLIYVIIISVVASWIPLSLIALSRVQTSDRQRLHIFQDMGVQPRDQPQATSELFADGRAMRTPVAGTVARGELRVDDHFYRGYRTDEALRPVEEAGEPAWYEEYPEQIELSRELLQRGQTHYDISCATCHGTAGYGDGLTDRRIATMREAALRAGQEDPAPGWVSPFNLHERDAQGLVYGGEGYPVGKLFHVISEGIRTMPAYKDQMSVEDRWAVTAYVRALQLSQAVPGEQVPDDVAELGEPIDPVPAMPDPDVAVDVDEVDLEDAELIAEGQQLFQTQACFTCHDTPHHQPTQPEQLQGPSFVDGIFGLEREVHLGPGGPVETIVVDADYFIESIADPMAKITQGYQPVMPPRPDIAADEGQLLALMAYVRSLGTHENEADDNGDE